MSKLAPSRSQTADIKALASKIEAAQAPEIQTLTTWLKQWKEPTEGAATPDEHGHRHDTTGMMSAEDMRLLASLSGIAFDRLFIAMMLTHHEGAVEMAKIELTDGKSAEAKALAQTIVTSQSAEIETMRALQPKLRPIA